MSTNSSIPIQTFHPPQYKNASLTDSTALHQLYYSSEPQPHSGSYIPPTDINDLNSNAHLTSAPTEVNTSNPSLIL